MSIPAGVVRNPQRPTVITLIDVATQLCLTANLDRPHHTKVANGHLMTMSLSIGRPKGPKDIRDL
jgi:hypothetical protein